MNVVEAEGKTRQEAVEAALQQLGVSEEDVIIEEVESGKSGIFGLKFGKQVKVRVMHKEINPVEEARAILTRIYELMGYTVSVDLFNYDKSDQKIYFTLSGDKAGYLIGRNGRNLEAVQLLINVIINRKLGYNVRIILDVDGYRKKRERSIIRKAKDLADKVIKSGKPSHMEPMNPFERRLVHLSLQSNDKIKTESEGTGENRKVKIYPKLRRKR